MRIPDRDRRSGQAQFAVARVGNAGGRVEIHTISGGNQGPTHFLISAIAIQSSHDPLAVHLHFRVFVVAMLGLRRLHKGPLTSKQKTTAKKTSQKQAAGKPLPRAEELQKGHSPDAGNDRTALVKNLQAFLEKLS